MIRKLSYASALAVAACWSTSSPAALSLGGTACSLTDISPTATACQGWFVGNLNSGSPADKADSAQALNALLGVSTFTGPTLTWLEDLTVSGNTVNFAKTLFGKTVVSFHVGGANGEPTGVGYQSTAFFAFDAGSTGLDTFSFNRAGLSNARLYSTETSTAVPEPSTWLMLLAGFGLVGGLLRRSRTILRRSFS